MSWLSNYVKDKVKYQLVNLSAVKIQHKWNERLNKFFIDSRAGLIVYRPKNKDDIARFRDKWINKIELLRLDEQNGIDRTADLFAIYQDIIKSEKVSYEANINTRLKGRLWNCRTFISRIF